ncbi:MAG: class I SAM-dependent methyltransferase [Betaproteobacteria bacterium]|jgi:SAM-dependent methyltransferase
MHGTGQASNWIQRFSHLVPRGARVLDVASGAGRHSRWFAARGAAVTAVDRDAAALQGLEAVARVVCADIENGPWPLPGEAFDAIIITNYLWRPLWPVWLSSLKPQGVLLVETFAIGHGRLGRPRNPDFLLQPGELLQLAQAGLHVLAYEDGLLGSAEPANLRRVQRMAAIRPLTTDVQAVGDWPLNPG